VSEERRKIPVLLINESKEIIVGNKWKDKVVIRKKNRRRRENNKL